MAIPTTNFFLIENSTGSGRVFESRYQSDTGALKISGLSSDSVTIECQIANEGFDPISGLEDLAENGIYSASPLPEGEIRVNRSGNNDNLTVILQRAT